MDDDKADISGIAAADLGIAAHKIKKNFGPVLHTCASVLTSLYFLGAHLEKIGDDLDVIIDVLMQSLSDAMHPFQVQLSGTLVT